MKSSSPPEFRDLRNDEPNSRRRTAQDVRDLGIAVAELALARVLLKRPIGTNRMIATEAAAIVPADVAKIERVGLAIMRAAKRVPWRADCLVRAKAAQRWLERSGIATTLRIGVKDLREDRLDAHAWLECGDLIVTGGGLNDYSVLITRA